ncbi:hypothetical protein BRADI_3g37403v3 [Brachypodium distachyon]|uniref:Uncharacterized protein n=1 Tax=Brachypodium distachyon TaxID=15368 RepID=A0A2K2D1R9_BRADI|nr:hypothetical protein BRADI_3g37403v3 [Brachypodium distachyon]
MIIKMKTVGTTTGFWRKRNRVGVALEDPQIPACSMILPYCQDLADCILVEAGQLQLIVLGRLFFASDFMFCFSFGVLGLM